MAIGDIYQLSHNQSLYGVTVVNVHHYKQETDSVGFDPEDDLAQAYEATVLPEYRDVCSTDWQSDCIVVRKIPLAGSFPEERSTGVAGLRSGEAMPPNAVATIGLYTDQYNKSGRGRVFISGLLVTDEIDNCWSNAAAGLLFDLGEAIRNDLDGLGPGGANYASGLYNSTTMVFNNTIAFRVNTQVRKLRGRTMKRACG